MLLLFGACVTSTKNHENDLQTVSDTLTQVDPVPDKPASSGDPLMDSLKAIEDQLPPRVYGVDISRYQGDELDFLDAKRDSLGFVFAKGTEGNTYVDPRFSKNWAEIESRGFIRGAYHFYRTNDAPETQLANFAKAIGTLHDDDLPPIVDFEEGSIAKGTTAAQIEVDLLKFLNALEKKYNRTPMLYTDIGTANKYLTKSDFLAYPLWIANYRKGDEPHLPNLWKGKDWKFWQKSQSYDINGTTNDCDIFNGNRLELLKFIKEK
jgi:lysozyme